MTNQDQSFLMTFSDEGAAEEEMQRRNVHRRDDLVLVDGPEDGEWSLMDIRSAIESDFLYRCTFKP